MLCATYTLFKELVPNGEVWQFFPHLHFPLQDDWDLEQKLRNVSIPYIEDSEIKDSTSVKSAIDRITLQYGDFVGVYGSFTSVHEARFDIVVTCFFIDTGRSILEYIEVIKFVLKAGGIWINVGPLHYHNPQAVPYSYRDVLSIVQLLGFELLKEEKLIMSYCGEEYVSMKPEMYNTPIAAFRKRSLTDEATTAQTTPQVKLHLDHPDYIIKR